jgi:triphosphoribosyl-dephospho-CoA synthetase
VATTLASGGTIRPMISDLHIWRTAAVIVKRYGDAAGTEAAQRADQLLADGDTVGQAVWLRIVRAIEELQRQTPEGAVH